MDPYDPFLRNFYFAITALFGSITALAYLRWKEMSRVEIALNVVIGLSFSFVVGPWAGHQWFRIAEADARGLCMITYAFAVGWPLIIPRVINWIKKVIPGQDEQEQKP